MKQPIIIKTAFALCSCVFVFSVYHLIAQTLNYKQAQKEYDTLAQYISYDPQQNSVNAQTDNAQTTQEINNMMPIVDFEALQKINKDIAGWIFIPGTNINYPVVQGENNNVYLNTTFQKKSNDSGAIFMDAEAQQKFTSRNTILYGHNMKNGSMFSALLNYKNKDFFESNDHFYIVTPEKNYRCEIYTSYICNVDEGIYKTDMTDADFVDYSYDTAKKSYYDTGRIPKKTDALITLSTCTNSNDSHRYVVQAILKEE